MTDSDTIRTYQSVAEEYAERNGNRSGVGHLVDAFLDAINATDTDDESTYVADIGCGPGWESATFGAAGHDVVAVDLTPAFLRLARENAPEARVARMDMRTLGLQRNTFHGLWVCASFLHVPRTDARDTLREFCRVLRPGGALLLSVKGGDGEKGGDVYDDDGRRFTLYRPDELRTMVSEAGFEVESVSADDETWIQLLART
ncbi:Methyltransferase domain-containing protein [Halogranum rubrum]|uniref:Methyltransferase domain-containing protein n=1 Tax=Halogranum rubrum TaxID=553466 RepID=A0A1I4DXL3_9EURY|nr:class I SAM-dependent methyltransferase [Halogranum rubrum]SFK98398.1 Methyltransferase domain-containing protein [Halogranum rubrum]